MMVSTKHKFPTKIRQKYAGMVPEITKPPDKLHSQPRWHMKDYMNSYIFDQRVLPDIGFFGR